MEAGDPLKLRDKLQCSICLEVFRNPLSLPCGHSFCQKCIHELFDAAEVSAAPVFSCPECRTVFPGRPEPRRHVILSNLVNDLPQMERSRAPVPVEQSGAHSIGPPLCQHHQQALTLYCSTDHRCICHQCLLAGCRKHEWQGIEELCQERREKLAKDWHATDLRQKNTGEEIERWKSKTENIKDFHEKMLSGMMAKFEQARKTLDECQMLVVESVTCVKDAAVSQAAEHVLLLQNHLRDLETHQSEAELLLARDGVAFLEGLPQLVPVGAVPEPPKVQTCGSLQLEAVSKILPEVIRLLQQELPNLLHPEKPVPKETSGTPSGVSDACDGAGSSRTSPQKSPSRIDGLRARLCKDYRNLKFDPETANKYLVISHEDRKAAHKRYRRNSAPNSPKRFQTWQVMCTEGFSEGSHYWEVGISTFFVELGVAYDSLKRTTGSTIGRNSSSWSLHLRSMHHSVWHSNQETKLQAPMFSEIGVHLDMTAGSLTFYGIKDDILQRLHSYSCIFAEKVFPIFWIGEDANVTLRTIPTPAVDTTDQGLQDLL